MEHLQPVQEAKSAEHEIGTRNHTTTIGSPSKATVNYNGIDHLLPVTDHVPVGSAAILESPHVSEGPGRIANAPVPSVYSDDRGEIHRLRVGHRRVNLLSSKKGVMRSGYLHPHSMSHFVVSGKVELWTLGIEATSKRVYLQGELVTLDPYTPHILHFLEDTISLEFWDGQFICYYYHPYRRVVQLQNSLVENNSNTGLHQHLVPQDTPEKSSTTPGVFWWSTGLVMGFALAILVGASGRRK